MSEIINTGLGWWANEDWLRELPGKIGSIETSGFVSLVLPVNTSAATNADIFNTGAILYDKQRTPIYTVYALVKSGNSPVYVVTAKNASSTALVDLLFISESAFTVYEGWSNQSPSGTPTNTRTSSPSYQGRVNTANTAISLSNQIAFNPAITDYSQYTINEIAQIFLNSGTSGTDFYKLNSGYSIACFLKWKRDATEELMAPFLISTDADYVPLSIDGETEEPGLVTGIEFGGMRFYVNLLLGYDGTVNADVPFEDITALYPDGANITDIFRAIVTFAQVRFTDPYAEGGNSEAGGGGGTFDLESDNIAVPSLPTMSFAATGFTRIYNPTLSELNSLANYLWTDTTFLDTVINHLKQLLENPMDAIISLALLPCPIPNGAPEAVKVMYINTGVTMSPATTQFVDVDCGTYFLQEFYGSALDYNPYTKVHCYLPYIGQVTLDTDEVMGKTIHVRYRIDIVTGMCAALISVNQSTGLDETVMYQFSGHCSINMPINSADFSGYIGAAMTAGKMVAGVVAGASGNLPLAAELIGAPAPKVTSTSETTETVKTRNPKTGRQVTQWSDTKQRKTMASGASFGEMTRKAAANTVGAVMGSKLTVEHAGGFTGNSGYLAVRRPYLIIERPRMCNPKEYGKYNGRPSMIYMNLGECSGYTEVQSIQFDGISATNPELAELSELLKSGVLF